MTWMGCTLKAADDRSSLGETELNENAPKTKKGTTCHELDGKSNIGLYGCKNCGEKKYAGHLGCGSLKISQDVRRTNDCDRTGKDWSAPTKDCCEDWYEWGMMRENMICQPVYDKVGIKNPELKFTGCSARGYQFVGGEKPWRYYQQPCSAYYTLTKWEGN